MGLSIRILIKRPQPLREVYKKLGENAYMRTMYMCGGNGRRDRIRTDQSIKSYLLGYRVTNWSGAYRSMAVLHTEAKKLIHRTKD